MNGLELCETLHKQYPHIQLSLIHIFTSAFFISGYLHFIFRHNLSCYFYLTVIYLNYQLSLIYICLECDLMSEEKRVRRTPEQIAADLDVHCLLYTSCRPAASASPAAPAAAGYMCQAPRAAPVLCAARSPRSRNGLYRMRIPPGRCILPARGFFRESCTAHPHYGYSSLIRCV